MTHRDSTRSWCWISTSCGVYCVMWPSFAYIHPFDASKVISPSTSCTIIEILKIIILRTKGWTLCCVSTYTMDSPRRVLRAIYSAYSQLCVVLSVLYVICIMTCRDCGLCESWRWKRIMWAWLPARITFLFCQSFHTCQIGWTRALVTRARRQLCVRSTNCSSICLYLLLFLLTVLQYYRDAERQYQHTGRLILTCVHLRSLCFTVSMLKFIWRFRNAYVVRQMRRDHIWML